MDECRGVVELPDGMVPGPSADKASDVWAVAPWIAVALTPAGFLLALFGLLATGLAGDTVDAGGWAAVALCLLTAPTAAEMLAARAVHAGDRGGVASAVVAGLVLETLLGLYATLALYDRRGAYWLTVLVVIIAALGLSAVAWTRHPRGPGAGRDAPQARVSTGLRQVIEMTVAGQPHPVAGKPRPAAVAPWVTITLIPPGSLWALYLALDASSGVPNPDWWLYAVLLLLVPPAAAVMLAVQAVRARYRSGWGALVVSGFLLVVNLAFTTGPAAVWIITAAVVILAVSPLVWLARRHRDALAGDAAAPGLGHEALDFSGQAPSQSVASGKSAPEPGSPGSTEPAVPAGK